MKRRNPSSTPSPHPTQQRVKPARTPCSPRTCPWQQQEALAVWAARHSAFLQAVRLILLYFPASTNSSTTGIPPPFPGAPGGMPPAGRGMPPFPFPPNGMPFPPPNGMPFPLPTPGSAGSPPQGMPFPSPGGLPFPPPGGLPFPPPGISPVPGVGGMPLPPGATQDPRRQ